METKATFDRPTGTNKYTFRQVIYNPGVYKCDFDEHYRFVSLGCGHVLSVCNSDGEVLVLDDPNYFVGNAFSISEDTVNLSFRP